MWRCVALAALCVAWSRVQAEEWDESNYPNPTKGGFRACKMKSRAQVCDPDGVLTEQERYRLNHELTQLEAKTRQDYAQNFCDKKGITASVALAKHIKGGSDAHVRALANGLRQQWSLDEQCQKSIVIVLSTEDRKFWVARDDRVPVYAGDFNEFFAAQKPSFQNKQYQNGLINILRDTAQTISQKQGSLPAPPKGGDDGGGRGRGPIGGGIPFKMPSIPSWVILAVVFVVIPTLICCCVCYCCCCRGKGAREPVAADAEGGGQRSGGGGGSGIRTFIQSMAGSYLMQMVMNCIRNQGQHRSAAPGGGYYPPGQGGYQPGMPEAREGQGLYPSKVVKDEGGGGSW